MHAGRLANVLAGKLLVMNCSFDRSIRIYRYEPDQDISMLQKFRDQVNGTSWAQCAFSADGEYVIAGKCSLLFKEQRH